VSGDIISIQQQHLVECHLTCSNILTNPLLLLDMERTVSRTSPTHIYTHIFYIKSFIYVIYIHIYEYICIYVYNTVSKPLEICVYDLYLVL